MKKKVLRILCVVFALMTVVTVAVAAADEISSPEVSSEVSSEVSEEEKGVIEEAWETFVFKLNKTFIRDNRWKLFVNGLGVTLFITFFSCIIGIVIGALTATVRFTHDKTGRLVFLNALTRIYITVIRGTPVTLQLLITYYVIFATASLDATTVAIAAFGLNSGAYVAEIVRSGMSAIESGQLEAGRSLGLTYSRTMVYIIVPQALKNILPALGNEFIVLLKETSVVGYIALTDLTRAGYVVQSLTYDAFVPLIAVAAIYLVLVMIFSKLVSMLERRLARSDRSTSSL